MANSPKKNQPPKEGGGRFFGCFGFPHPNNHVDDMSNENYSKPSLDDFITKVPKKRKWFIWARHKRSATTVPLDATAMPEKPRRSWSCKDVNNMVMKRDKKEKNISQPVNSNVDSVQSPEPESTITTRKTNKTRSNSDNHVILANKKSSLKTTSLDPIEKAMCQENPPPLNPKTTKSTTTTVNSIAHSTYLPLVYNKGKKLATTNSGEDSPITATKKSKDTVIVNRVDSVLGMSIILVMLLIMLMWGKVCAILCTSAWFYFVPWFGVKKELSKAYKMDSSSTSVDQIDINSHEYKKKVVLEGLLDRNKHRKNVVSSSK